MKWKKLGKIFDPRDHKLPNNCKEFAQSPQALVFDNFVRIYFSCREKDWNGKFISHIAFVDFDKNFRNIIDISFQPVIAKGKLGCYDEHGIFPLNIFRDNDKIFAYIGGWSRRVSVSVETSIGISESKDNGLTFKRLGDGPVLSSSLHEPFLVGDPFVAKFDKLYYLWYIYGERWINGDSEHAERIYKIGYAISKDAINWKKQHKKLIADRLNPNECQALPSVIFHRDKYHMVFCYRQAIDFRNNNKNAYRLGYAYSKDLKNWIREDENLGIDVSENGWDSEMMAYPNIFHCNNKIYLLYNGNNFGRFGFGLAVLEE
nr:hypothetical protein [uncultured Marinifilum sp.]